MAVGERIRQNRLNKKMTQKELGEKAGIAEPTIRRYELGKLNPKFETLQKIAGALDISIAQLLSTEQQVGLSALQYFAEDTTEGRSKELHRSFDLLNKENQIKVIDYSDSLLKAEMYDENRKKR